MSHVTDALCVYEAPSLRMRRVGREHDGGYVIAETSRIWNGYDVFLSGGIANDSSFECGILELYSALECDAYDPGTTDGRFYRHERLHFHQAPVSPMIGRGNALVKLDVEGAEWEWLALSHLEGIAQLVVELHSPHHALWDWHTLARLAQTHALVHAHGNNWDGIVDIEGVRVPGTLETTWVRRDLAGELRPNTKPIPGPLDMPNVPERPDHVIDWMPFVHPRAIPVLA